MSNPLQTAGVREEIESLKSERLNERLRTFDLESLAWLAVVPVWTEGLAVQAGFPIGNSSLDDFLKEATDAGICDRELES